MARSDGLGSRGAFAIVVTALAIIGSLLYRFYGLPHLPRTLPAWQTVVATLQGPAPPLDALAYGFLTIADLLWLYLVATLLLRVIVALLTAVADPGWLRPLQALSDHVTLPVLRRLVDGVVAAVLVANLVGRPALPAVAAPASAHSAPAVAPMHPSAAKAETKIRPTSTDQARPRPAVEAPIGVYTVRSGDTLWGISERSYGNGAEFKRIVEANVGRRMPDVRVFDRRAAIFPGDVLVIPTLSTRVERHGTQSFYVVEPGDTLSGIAQRIVGDETRWPEIFALNRGVAHVDGFVLEDPNLIWPGLRLRLSPAAPEPARQPPAAAPAKQAPAPVVPRTEAPTTQAQVGHPAPGAQIPLAPTPTASLQLPSESSPPAFVAPAPLATAPTTSAPRVLSGESSFLDALSPHAAVEALGLVSLLAVGATAALARRRFFRRLGEPPLEAPPGWWNATAAPGFADDAPDRLLARPDRAEEPVALLAGVIAQWLEEHQVTSGRVLSVAMGGREAAITVTADLVEREQILRCSTTLGERLGATCSVDITTDHDLLLRVSKLSATRLGLERQAQVPRQALVPLGVLPGGMTWHGNWDELGNVLVVGLAGDRPDVVLTSLLVSLAARCAPRELQFVTIANRYLLPERLCELPHQRWGFVSPDDPEAVARALAEVRDELTARMQSAKDEQATVGRLRLITVIGDLGKLQHEDLPGEALTTLELLATHGPALGMSVLAAADHPEAVGDHLDLFETRVVLQTLDDEQSVRLLGMPDAARLRGGELFIRLDGRTPVRSRGFQVSPERLEHFVRLVMETPATPRVEQPSIQGLTDQPNDPSADPISLADEGVVCGEAASTVLSDQGSEAISPPVPPSLVHDLLDAGLAATGHANRTVEAPAVEDPYHRRNGAAEKALDPSLADSSDAGGSVGMNVVANGGIQHELLVDVSPERDELTTNGVADVEVKGGLGNRAILEIRCFGRLEILAAGRELVPSGAVGFQAKPWEGLLFLATHPSGIVDREELLMALWPEAPTEQAMKRLSSTLKRLRDLLAEQWPDLPNDIVRWERDGRYRLSPTLVVTDAQLFWSLSEEARKQAPAEARDTLSRAHAIYRGELLTEPHLDFAWLDERGADGLTLAERYRERFCHVACKLAAWATRNGRLDETEAMYRSALVVEPYLEPAALGLYRCYQRLADAAPLSEDQQRIKEAIRHVFGDPDQPGERVAADGSTEATDAYEEALVSAGSVGGELPI